MQTITVVSPTVFTEVTVSHITFSPSEKTMLDSIQECGFDIYNCVVFHGRLDPILIEEMELNWNN